MEKSYTLSKKVLLVMALILLLIGITTSSLAATKLYTEGLKKGDELSFTKNGATAWCVYKNKADAKKTGITLAVKFITPKDKITILSVATDCNVLKVKVENSKTNYTGFIHYGSDAAKYFEKVNKEIPVKQIKLDKTTPLNMKTGETVSIKANILPANATYKDIEVYYWNNEWYSLKQSEMSKTNIMKIENKKIKNGVLTFSITAKKAGTATLYVRAINDLGATAEATRKITITDPVVNVKKIKLDKEEALVTLGSTLNLKATFEPENATDKTITWKSSNAKVAKVDNKGKISTVSEGRTIITAQSKNGKISQCVVYVLTKEHMELVEKIPGTIIEKIQTLAKLLNAKISFENEKETVTYGKEEKIDFSKKLKGAKGLEIEYSSSNKKIATIDSKGIVTINKNNKLGTTEIKAKVKNTDKVATCKLTVEAQKVVIESVVVKDKNGKTEGTLELNKEMELTAQVKENTGKAENQKMGYTNNNSEIVDLKIVNDKIILKGLKTGETTIVVRSLIDETKTATYKVKVVEPQVEVTRVRINGRISSKITMQAGETQELKVEVLPENASNKEVEWKSSDEKIAKVDQNGKVTAISGGTAKITAVSKQNSSKKATCTVVVKSPTTIKLNKTFLRLGAGEKYTLKAEVTPANTKVTWESSNTKFATVDQNGAVTINNKEILNKNSIKIGDKVTITAKAGDAVATCEIERIAITIGKIKVGDAFDYTTSSEFKKIVKNGAPKVLELQNDGKTVKAIKVGIAKVLWQRKDGTYCKSIWYVQNTPYNHVFFAGKIYKVNQGIYCDAYTKHTNSELDSGEHYWHLRGGDKFQVIEMDGNWVKVKIYSLTSTSKKYFKEGEQYYIFVTDNTDQKYFTPYAWEQI